MAQDSNHELASNKQEVYKFEYKYKKDMQLFYDINVIGTVSVEIGNKIEKNPIYIKMKIKQTVVDITENVSTIKMKIEKAQFIQNNEIASLPEEGSESIVKISKNGKIEFVQGSWGWNGSEFSQLQFPEKPIKIGFSWEQINLTMDQNVKTMTHYEFVDVIQDTKGKYAKFNARLTVNTPEEKSKGFSRGYILFDIDQGIITYTEAETNFSFPVPIPHEVNRIATSTTQIKTIMNLANIVSN